MGMMYDVNVVAVLVAAIIGMALGALWYSPALFGKMWMNMSKMTDKDLAEAKKKGMTQSYVLGFVGLFVTLYVLGIFMKSMGAMSVQAGLMTGFLVWLGFFATTMLGSVLWENKPWGLYLLNVAHYLVTLLVGGAILGAWP